MDSKRVEEDYKALVASNTWSAVYQSITQRCHSYRYTCVEAKKSENKSLNRYRDVSPYDHSRIVLRREGFDYINANLVKVERANRQYILTQGPLVTTSSHFWLMIWEQNCPAVIMLNRVYENLEVKCHWYWPPKEQKILKQIPYTDVNMTVSRVSELDCNYYTIRKLRVTNHDTEESRFIWQFHYTNWPDFGVPESPHAFLVFLEHVKEYGALDGREGPAVVHCSAGIGRSGTFCLVDSVLVLVQNEGQANVDVQEVLLEMRRYRMGLVQTSEQFRFSYKAIIEGIKRMDPDYEPNSDVVPEPEQVVPRQEEEAPPPPPPRGESLGQPPARPLPAIPASASMDIIELNSSIDSDASDLPPTPPPRPRHVIRSRSETRALPASASMDIIELSSDEDMPPTPPPRPEDTDPGSPAGSSYEDIDEDQDIAESLDGAEAEVGGGERSGVRRRRNDALAERVADMKKRSREADRWNTVKRSFLKPLAISVSVGLLAVAGVLIYSYTHRH